MGALAAPPPPREPQSPLPRLGGGALVGGGVPVGGGGLDSAGPPFPWTAQNFALFFLSPAGNFFLTSLWEVSLNFGGVSEECARLGSGCCVEPRRPHQTKKKREILGPPPLRAPTSLGPHQKQNWPNAVWPNSVNIRPNKDGQMRPVDLEGWGAQRVESQNLEGWSPEGWVKANFG